MLNVAIDMQSALDDDLQKVIDLGVDVPTQHYVVSIQMYRNLFALEKKMSAQIDALTAEVAQVVNVLTSATPLVEAAVTAETQLASLLAGAAPDVAAVQAAINNLATARTVFSAEVAKLTPAATTPAATTSATVTGGAGNDTLKAS